MANLPNPDQLGGLRVVDKEADLAKELQLKSEIHGQDLMEKLLFLLPDPGLPTVPLKLAQRIWSLEFIEMEEFLPSHEAGESQLSARGCAGSHVTVTAVREKSG